jgi:hypothetical protein
MSDDPTARVLAAIAQLGVEVVQLRGDMTQLPGDMIDRTDGLRADMMQFRADMDRLRIDVMGRMDRLPSVFSGMQQDITVNFAAADRAERIARNAADSVRDEMRAVVDQVSAMERQIRTLGARVTHLVIGDNGLGKQG